MTSYILFTCTCNIFKSNEKLMLWGGFVGNAIYPALCFQCFKTCTTNQVMLRLKAATN